MVKQTSALLFVYYFYSKKQELGGNCLCGLKYISHVDFLFLDMCLPSKWEPFICWDSLSCTNSKTLPNLELIWLAGLRFFLTICMKFTQ